MNDATDIGSIEDEGKTDKASRPPAPEGMVYNRKGVLVKRRAIANTRGSRLYLVLQVKDDDGNVLSMDKKNIHIIEVFRNSDKVLELLDKEENEGAFYVRLEVPAQR